MLFLVQGEWVEVGALVPPEQVASLIESTVLPSLEMFVRWEEEGRLHGGILAGQRAGVFVLEAASSEEVGQLLASLSLAIKAVSSAGPLPPVAAGKLAEVQRVADLLGREVPPERRGTPPFP